jgi:glycerophosphoryl diester phosphodiesterase
MNNKILKIGHRGAMGHEPESTLRSFRKALELHVDAIEFDVHVCNTGEVVVIHDDKVNRTTNGTGYVEEMSFKELRKLNAGKSEVIPTLSEALDLVDRQAKVNIELKGKNTAIAVSVVLEHYIFTKGWEHSDFFISSFDHHELIKFKKLHPDIKIGTLFESIPLTYLDMAKEIGAYSINLSVNCLDMKSIKHAHENDLKVFVYTVNNIEEIKRVKDLGVDGIFSNYPERL